MTQIQPASPSLRQVLSPTKTNSDYCSKNQFLQTRADDNFTHTSISAFNAQLSITQKQIYSHDLIKQVMQKSKNKTVQHDVNRISVETKLYNVPKQPIKNEFHFDAIPPNNKDFVSTASQKVKQIHHRLSDKKDLAERLVQLAEKNKEKYAEQKRSRPSLADNVNRRVSVSGLVTYNFNSVNARRSLGSIPNQPQQVKLSNKISETRRRNSCNIQRQNSIIRRKPNFHNMQKLQFGKAAVCDFHTQTDKFLRVLKKQGERDEKIYGQRMQKLNCIKQYMQKQQTDYDQAKFIVQAILSAQPKQIKEKKVKKVVTIDDDHELAKRRQALTKKRIMLRHLCFTE